MSNLLKNDLEYNLQLDDDLIDSNFNSTRAVLIKHNYYSSENTHGFELLMSCLKSLDWNYIKSIYIIDSGVKLLKNSDFVNLLSGPDISNLNIYSCSSSVEFYGIDTADASTLSEVISPNEFFEYINNEIDLIVIE